MENIISKNLTLAEEVDDALSNKKSNKNKVMRVNPMEENLLMYLRQENVDMIRRELKQLIRLCDSKYGCPCNHSKEIYNILCTYEKANTIDYLINSGFITEEQLESLSNALSNGKNIIITGNVGIGKNYLMDALLSLQEGLSFNLISDKSRRFNLSEEFLKKNNTTVFTQNLNINDFVNPKYKNNIFVFNEIVDNTDLLSLLTALEMGKQVFATTYSLNCSNLIDKMCSSSDEDIKSYAKTILNKNKFIIVTVSQTDKYSRFVSNIEGLD